MKNTLVMMAVMAAALSLGACHTLRSFNECMEPETAAPMPVQSTTTTKTTTTTVQHQ